MAIPSRGTSSVTRARFRNSRSDIVSRVTDPDVSSATMLGNGAVTVTANRPARDPAVRSSTCENRRPLLEEGPRTFGHVLRPGEQREMVRLEIESVVERRFRAAYDGLDARRERERAVHEHLTKHRIGGP